MIFMISFAKNGLIIFLSPGIFVDYPISFYLISIFIAVLISWLLSSICFAMVKKAYASPPTLTLKNKLKVKSLALWIMIIIILFIPGFLFRNIFNFKEHYFVAVVHILLFFALVYLFKLKDMIEIRMRWEENWKDKIN